MANRCFHHSVIGEGLACHIKLVVHKKGHLQNQKGHVIC